MNETQSIVTANVAARGYRDGWTTEQFVARQLCKLTEELDEAAHQVVSFEPQVRSILWWLDELNDSGQRARIAFDDQDKWENVTIFDPFALRSELADMMVVICAAADALESDVIQAAIDKSAVDVARGVR